MTKTLSSAGLARIQRYEACSLVIYDDQAGLPTIGWGHLIKKGEDFSAGISEDRALDLFIEDLKSTIEGVNACLEVEVTQNAFDALTSLAFNIGVGALRKSTALRCVNSGDLAGAAKAFLLWNKVRDPKTGKLVVSNGLTKRRESEAAVLLEPDP